MKEKDRLGSAFVHYERADDDNEETSYLGAREIPRDDPDLVATIKLLGSNANGPHARLKIVEIPADVEWEISEYDGKEHVAEKHRVWY